MIHAIYDREAHKLTVKGHAQYAVHGKDIICSAVSILVFTLAQSVAELNEKKLLDEQTIRLDDGDVEISCKGQFNRCYNLLFDQICTGLEILETMYPDNVKLSLV